MVSVYAYLTDVNLTSILVQNDTDNPIMVPCNHRLGLLTDINRDAYHVLNATPELTDLALRGPRPSPPAPLPNTSPNKIKRPLGATIYSDHTSAALQFIKLLNEFPSVFINNGYIDIPKEH